MVRCYICAQISLPLNDDVGYRIHGSVLGLLTCVRTYLITLIVICNEFDVLFSIIVSQH